MNGFERSERLERNRDSRNRAEHFREPWSELEDEVLALWQGGESDLAELGEMLGRTIEACRERFYKNRRADQVTYTARVTRQTTAGRRAVSEMSYRGWTEEMGDE